MRSYIIKILTASTLAASLSFTVSEKLCADVVYLKNGRSVEGVIKHEDENVVELEVYKGKVMLNRSDVERIERSSAAGAPEELRQKWQEQEKEDEARRASQPLMPIEKPKMPKRDVDITQKHGSIIVNVTLNRDVDVKLILDTGASLVMLRKKVAEKLGMDVKNIKPNTQVGVADGRTVAARHIVLKSVKVERAEAENVDAVIILDEMGDIGGDGLLGMSFLNKFNFKIDHDSNSLILEER